MMVSKEREVSDYFISLARSIKEDPYKLREGADGELATYLDKYIQTYKP
jgi:hypothetical protein